MSSVQKTITILFVLFALFGANAIGINNDKAEGSSNDTLIFAHALTRHGDRNPRTVDLYPTDPWRDPSHWPGGRHDIMTNLGMQSSYELGKYLRKRYETLLGNKSYSDDLIYFHATDVERVIQCASLVAAGLFPPSPNQTWNSELKWYPVPIHTIPIQFDHVLYAERPCERYNRAFRKYLQSNEYKEEIEKYKNLIQYLEKHSGLVIKENLRPLHFLYDVLLIEDLKNKTLPDWAQKVYGPGSQFEYASNRYFQTFTSTPELSRLSYGFLIRDILDRCAEVIKGTLSPKRSLWLYFGHDTNIASILNIFGLYDNIQPPYSSSLFFDLYKTIDNKFYLQLSYKNSSDQPVLLSFPKCGTKCSLSILEKIYKESIPHLDFEEECRLPLHIKAIDSVCACETTNCLLTMVSLVLLVALFFSWCAWKRKHKQIF